ncbi:hypothetical protein BGZ61DRAFT_530839 [Ilyonectria robusta]|uniref:uncharacterized protein n=1 Tax=Ilyonectria robusta TaxID=1079257 RepID=UPI001E8E3C31|nr:uncharacterized protein BGZ61DRAFT_530839 [Ilyonectria robusta]KAH8714177.1 hypothetical protein BGZ61DRAFT_530839 [Ilyonectria robusta]
MRSQSPTPHPNQVRSACERCRRQKLRCSRPAAASASCARCARLSLPCQPGPQRRIGRPLKKDLVLRKASGSSDTAVSLDVLADSCPGGEIQFLEGLLDDTVPATEWTTAFNSQFGSGCSETVGFPLEIWSPIQELELPSYEHQLILPTNTHFEALSRLNVDIRKGLENITRFAVQPTFEDFICTPHTDMDGYKNVQLLMTNGQAFLDIIMALHRQLGTRSVPRQTRPPSPNPFALALDSCFTTPAKPSSTETTPDDDLPESTTHDAPTMLLVISCYVQLIKHIEILLDIVYASINDPKSSPIGRAPMSYADVPIVQPSSQFILFCELVCHVVAQINLVLGLPSAWSGRSAWTGLLRPQRYRNLVNAELGAVDGSWTTRPAKVLEKTKMTKEMFVELAMMGLDA